VTATAAEAQGSGTKSKEAAAGEAEEAKANESKSAEAADTSKDTVEDTTVASVSSTSIDAATPPMICNDMAPQPDMQFSHTWQLLNASKDVCHRMFSDQASSLKSFGRNWCWVMVKRYGCIAHLGDAFTWAEARDAVSELGGVPSRASSPFEPLQDAHLCDRRRPSSPQKWTEAELAEAADWFQENVRVYVLNLRSQEERWQNVSGRLRELSITSERVPGFNVTDDEDLAQAYREGAIPEDYSIDRAQEEAKRPQNGMGGIMGTVGCAAGHFRTLSRASSAEGRKPITLVLEDDAYPHDEFVPQVWNLVNQELPCGWDAVSLSSRCPYGKCVAPHVSRVSPDENEPEWRCRHGVNYGFQGVLYRTEALKKLQSKWKPVVFDETRPHCLDVDVALASISDRVSFYAVPSLQAFLTERQDHDGSVRRTINGASA